MQPVRPPPPMPTTDVHGVDRPVDRFIDRLQRVRGHYQRTPWIEPRADESPLLRSWQRSEQSGMHSGDQVAFELVTRSLLSEIDDRHGALIGVARPEMERLAHALRRANCAVMLVNEHATVVDRLLHDAAAQAPLQCVSRKGVNLDEGCVGTTAPSIVLQEGVPYLVGRDAHFVASNRAFFCVAAPIDDPWGRRVGALNIAAYDSVPSFDVLSLVVHAAAGVENRLFVPSADQLVVHFHARPELVGTAMEGIISVDTNGHIVGVNRGALRLLCESRAALIGSAFSDLMATDMNQVFSLQRGHRLAEMETRSGLQVSVDFAAATGPADTAWTAAVPAAAPAAGNIRDAEMQMIVSAMDQCGGNIAAASRQLGISRSTIYRRLGERTAGGAPGQD